MAKWKLIYSSNCAFNGVEYQATSNGILVHLQSRNSAARFFRTAWTINKTTWDQVYSQSWHRNDPALISSLIAKLNNLEYEMGSKAEEFIMSEDE